MQLVILSDVEGNSSVFVREDRQAEMGRQERKGHIWSLSLGQTFSIGLSYSFSTLRGRDSLYPFKIWKVKFRKV